MAYQATLKNTGTWIMQATEIENLSAYNLWDDLMCA